MKSLLHLLCAFALVTQGVVASTFGPTQMMAIPNNKVVKDIVRQPQKVSAVSSLDTALQLCAGACSDSNPALFLKVALSAALEATTMVGLIVGSKKVTEKVQWLPSVFGLPLLQWVSLFAIIFASSFFGSIVDGGLSTATNQVLDPNVVPGDSDWFANLAKPSWNPPGWVFPIMWLIVSKPTQLVAVSKILKKAATVASESDTTAKLPIPILAVYCTHLALGDAWNKVFFGLQCPGRGVAVITTFFGLLLTSAYLFYSVDPLAGKFMLPTCGWVFVATALNWSIYLKNK
jgi:tryptophan-rich sensory protein